MIPLTTRLLRKSRYPCDRRRGYGQFNPKWAAGEVQQLEHPELALLCQSHRDAKFVVVMGTPWKHIGGSVEENPAKDGKHLRSQRTTRGVNRVNATNRHHIISSYCTLKEIDSDKASHQGAGVIVDGNLSRPYSSGTQNITAGNEDQAIVTQSPNTPDTSACGWG